MDTGKLLLEKARLLIVREREFFSLRRHYQRRGVWLDLARRLPEAIDPRGPLAYSLQRMGDTLIQALELQRVSWFTVDSERGIAPFTDGQTERYVPLDPAVSNLLFSDSCGACALPDTREFNALGGAVGFSLFLWFRLERQDGSNILLVAGFDEAGAEFHDPFGADDIDNFCNTGHQLELLIKNRDLLAELERDKLELARFNHRLEQEVVVRSSELANTLEALREREARIQADIEEAQRFQDRILPTAIESDEVEFRWVFDPLAHVGGDIFDVAQLGPHRFRIFLADAAGHGVQASLRTMVLKAEYEHMKTLHESPADTLAALNERLTALFPGSEMLCTGCVVDVEVSPGCAQVTYANAAHPPLLYWVGDSLRELWTIGPFLGVEGRVRWPPPATLTLGANDLLLVYTDGLTEQRDPRGDSFESTLKTLQLSDLDVDGGVELVMRQLDAFRAGAPRVDDLTLVAMRVKGVPSHAKTSSG